MDCNDVNMLETWYLYFSNERQDLVWSRIANRYWELTVATSGTALWNNGSTLVGHAFCGSFCLLTHSSVVFNVTKFHSQHSTVNIRKSININNDLRRSIRWNASWSMLNMLICEVAGFIFHEYAFNVLHNMLQHLPERRFVDSCKCFTALTSQTLSRIG